MADEYFKLTPPPNTSAGQNRHGGARPGAGRPPGSINRRSEKNWEIVEEQWPDTLRGVVAQAARINDPSFRFFSKHEQRLILDCAFWIGARAFPEPKAAPLQIGIALDRANLVAAVEAGELTASDAAALGRLKETVFEATAGVPIDSVRAEFSKRLWRIKEAQPAAPDAAATEAPTTPAAAPSAEALADAMTEDQRRRLAAALERLEGAEDEA